MKPLIKKPIYFLVLLLLVCISSVNAQNKGSINKSGNGANLDLGPFTSNQDDSRTSTLGADNIELDSETTNIVLFYRYQQNDSQTQATLVASRTEDLKGLELNRTPLKFTHYRWFYMGKNNTISDGTNFNPNLVNAGYYKKYEANGDNQLTLSKLTEGYHYIKVQGIINPDNLSNEDLCQVQEETYVIYVLPRLTINPTTNDSNTTTTYCEIDASTQNIVTIKTNYSFTAPPTDSSTIEDFEVKYRWYAVDSNVNQDLLDKIETNPTEESINAILLMDSQTNNLTPDSTLPEFVPRIDKVGNYKVFVEIEYLVKDRNYDGPDNGDNRKRPYAIYRGFVKHGDNDMILHVTPRPGKPHITILEVVD